MEWLEGVSDIGITAGASAPEDIVQGIVNRIREMSASSRILDLEIVKEDVTFALPAVLRTF